MPAEQDTIQIEAADDGGLGAGAWVGLAVLAAVLVAAFTFCVIMGKDYYR